MSLIQIVGALFFCLVVANDFPPVIEWIHSDWQGLIDTIHTKQPAVAHGKVAFRRLSPTSVEYYCKFVGDSGKVNHKEVGKGVTYAVEEYIFTNENDVDLYTIKRDPNHKSGRQCVHSKQKRNCTEWEEVPDKRRTWQQKCFGTYEETLMTVLVSKKNSLRRRFLNVSSFPGIDKETGEPLASQQVLFGELATLKHYAQPEASRFQLPAYCTKDNKLNFEHMYNSEL